MQGVPYYKAVGSLMYLALATQPDITYAVAILSCFSVNPGSMHWEAVKQVFKYLKGMKELWLTYGMYEGGDKLLGYSDADGSMAEDHHAISGYVFLINGGTVTWSLKKQDVISLSMTESKYIVAAHGAKEALWL